MLRLGNATTSGKPGRRRKVKSQPQPVTVPRSRPLPKRRRKPQKVSRSVNGSPWWLMAELKVSSNTPPGPLEGIVLHPTLFPDTPYATQCAHHTHRKEQWWELDIRVTTAANTGFRAAVLFLADPRMAHVKLPSQLVWSAVLNRTGTLATSTGTGQHRTKFHVPSTTPMLSNANPDPTLGNNLVGFAAGMVAIQLLDPPIGLTGDSQVNITILARVNLQLIGPITGFMSWTVTPPPGPTPGPQPQPTGSSFSWTVSATGSMALNDHTASAWLAGGYYLKIESGNRGITGEVWSFAIYQIENHPPKDWEDNDSVVKQPEFLVTWEEPGSPVLQVVGFQFYQDAWNQAAGHTGKVPHGAELCIRYHNGGEVAWGDKFRGLGDQSVIVFNLLKKTPQSQLWRSTRSLNSEGRGLFTVPAPTLKTEVSPLSQPPTSLLGLTSEINILKSAIQELKTTCEQLAINSTSSSQQSEPSNPSHQRTQAWVQSLANWAPSFNWLTGQRPKPCINLTQSSPPSINCASAVEQSLPHSIPSHIQQQPLPLESTSWPSNSSLYSLHSAPAAMQMQQPTGCRQLPNDWDLPECPGCDDPDCEDCFEDDPDNPAVEPALSIPSQIGSVDSLIAALSRLGGTEV